MSKLFVQNKIIIDHSKIEKIKCKVTPANVKGDPSRDRTKPIFFWFQDTPLGKEIFLVLYTKKCAWARCSFCSLPSVSSPDDIEPDNIIKQAEYVFNELTTKQLSQAKILFISNNGSVLDQDTMDPEVLGTICQLGYERCPSLECIAFETRIQTVEKSEILYYLRNFQVLHKYYVKKGLRKVKSPVKLQISIGYETQDPYIRNEVLCKDYPEDVVQNYFKLCSDAKSETGNIISCDIYVLLKPINSRIKNEEAIAESVQTIIHLNKLSEYFNIPVSVRLNPTFVAEGSYLHKKFLKEDYTPPTLKDVVNVLQKSHEENVNIPIFVGLKEEELAVFMGSFNRGTAIDSLYFEALQKFNYTQDYEYLKQCVDLIENNYAKSPIGRLSFIINSISQEMENLLGDFRKSKLNNINQIVQAVTISPDELKRVIRSGNIILNSIKKIKPIGKRKKILHR